MDRDLLTPEQARAQRARLIQDARTYAIIYNARNRRISKLGYLYFAFFATVLLTLIIKGVWACIR
jgi:hypothetical protein